MMLHMHAYYIVATDFSFYGTIETRLAIHTSPNEGHLSWNQMAVGEIISSLLGHRPFDPAAIEAWHTIWLHSVSFDRVIHPQDLIVNF